MSVSRMWQKSVVVVTRFCTVRTVHSSYQPRNFSSAGSQPTEFLHCDAKNVFKSPFPDIDDFPGHLWHKIVWRNVEKWWNKVALVSVDSGRSYTFRELRRLSGKFATSLRKLDIENGETIAVVLPNVPEFAVVALGASEAGVLISLINPGYTAEEIRKQLDISGATAVITVPDKYPTILESIQGNSAIRLPIILVNNGESLPSGALYLEKLISEDVTEFQATSMKNLSNPGDTSILPFSSGTTGLPKAVEITHRNVNYAIAAIENALKISGEPSSTEANNVIPAILPFFHIYGLICIALGQLSLGNTLVCVPQFSPNALLKVFDQYPVTHLLCVPPILQLMAQDKRFTQQQFKHLRTVLGGAAPMGHQVMTQFRRVVGPNVHVCQGYALTETTAIIATSKNCPNAPIDSVGVLFPKTEVRIVGCSEENLETNLGCNEVGEIYVKGPQIMKGYYKNPKATVETMGGEWLKTGDLGSFDDSGYLYICGRLKELIKVQGFQVAPAELEDLLQGHPDVADAAVIGVPHERCGEVPKAFVVSKPGRKILEHDVMSFVAERVAKYKQLGSVAVVDKIPKSAAGKILKKELKKM